MIDVFNSLKGFLRPRTLILDNPIFQMHYRATVLLMLCFSLVITSRQFFGEPIHCINPSDPDVFSQKVLDAYCWVHSTFTMPKTIGKKVGVEIAHPGVDKSLPGDKRIHHAYYQWVCFVLFIQALMFYAPRWLWRSWEGGIVRQLSEELNSTLCPSEVREKKIKSLVAYFRKNLGRHKVYFYRYVVCEILNFVNVVGQIYFVDKFLGGEFTTYGSRVLEFMSQEQVERYDPMVFVFPRITKCVFHRYGPSGDVTTLDALCILPQNIINEKIYVFIWFWFVLLSTLSGLAVVYRLVTTFFPRARNTIIKTKARLTPTKFMDAVLKHCSFDDWFLLQLINKNMDAQNFCDFIAGLSAVLSADRMLPEKELPSERHELLSPNGLAPEMSLLVDESTA